MYIFTNALKNIWRNKGKNILYALIVLAIIIIATMGIMIRNTSAGLISSYRSQYGSRVIVSPDFSKMSPTSNTHAEPPTPEQSRNFAKSSLLQKSEFTARVPVNPEKLTMIDQEDEKDDKHKSFIAGGDGGASQDMVMPKAYLVGYDKAEISDEFKTGKRQIRQGAKYSKADDCLISEELAKLNNLSVGDTITLDGMKKGATPASFHISGIYADSVSSNSQLPFKDPLSNRSNEIISSMDAVLNSTVFKDAGSLDGEYYLKDPDDLEAFHKELTRKGLSDSFKVTTDEAAYKKAISPLESLKKITTIFLVLVIGLGAIVLLLLSLMSMRSRRYEIGVLRAIGMKKGKVALGLVSEVIVIVAACLALGLAVGDAATQPVAQSLLQSQVSSYEQEEKDKKDKPGDGSTMIVSDGRPIAASDDVKTPEMRTTLDARSTAQIAGVSLGLVLISSLVSIGATTRWEPRRILSEGN